MRRVWEHSERTDLAEPVAEWRAIGGNRIAVELADV